MGGGASKSKTKYEYEQVTVKPAAPKVSDTTSANPSRRGVAASHVAIIGAGFVGTSCAFALLSRGTGARVTLTDVNTTKCEGEVLDLQDGGGNVKVATPQEAGQADVIVITAGRGQREGETRLDLVKANAGILKSILSGMQPIKETAKIIVVSNPCDALTYVAQECSGLPTNQVFGSGTVLDSRRLRIALSRTVGVHHSSIVLYVLGEHGDSQFPAPSLATIGGVPFLKAQRLQGVDLKQMSKDSANKAYEIISRKNYTAFGVAMAVESIVACVLNDRQQVLPVSVRPPGKKCCLSLPTVVGINGVERVLAHVAEHFDADEAQLYQASIERMEEAAAAAMA